MSDAAPTVHPSPGAPAAGNGSARQAVVPAATTPVPVVVEEPPPQIQQLPRGAILPATVGPQLTDGRVVLQLTSPLHLSLHVELPNPPPPGTELRLRVVTPGAPTRLVMLPQPTTTVAAKAPNAAGLAAKTPAPLTTGNVTSGNLLSPSPLNISPGKTVSGIIQPLFGRTSFTTPVAPHGLPSLPAGHQPGWQPTTATFRILAIHPPNTPGQVATPPAALAAPAKANPASPMAKTVTGTVQHSSARTTTVQTPSATITLQQPASVPAGSQIVLRLEAGALPLTATAAPLATLGAALPSLPNALDVLSTMAPAEAAYVRETVVPTTGPRLTTGLLFFMSALNRADFAGWLGGTAARALQALPPETLAPRLAEEFTQLARSSAEPMPGEWRAMPLPLFHGEEFHHLRLFIQGDGANEQDRPGDTRFVIEADLSQLGPIQLDGRVRDTTKFDLTLRTTRPLSESQQGDLTNLFAEAGTAANFAGTLHFEVLPVLPTPAIDDAPPTTMGVFA